MSFLFEADILPLVFLCIMGISIFAYAILDGYDLGVGMLIPLDKNKETERDMMIASIGPFWDANETWLVLAVGIMLIAFPAAHALMLYHLYLPAAFMLLGLILRGVAFDFRAKAALDHKYDWDRAFKFGSLLTSLTQGYMLGQYVVGFDSSTTSILFSLLSSICVSSAYCYIGATWLILKTEKTLQQTSIRQAKLFGRFALLGILAVSTVNPIINYTVFERWFDQSYWLFMMLIPAICFSSFIFNEKVLNIMPFEKDRYCWLPITLTVTIFLCCFIALGISFFPYIIPGKITAWEAASATASLQFILVGALIVVPVILAYTCYSYWVFRGKTAALQYH